MKGISGIWWKAASVAMVFALVGAAFVAVPAAPASADDGTPPGPERGKDRGERLEQVFEREQDWLKKRGRRPTWARPMPWPTDWAS